MHEQHTQTHQLKVELISSPSNFQTACKTKNPEQFCSFFFSSYCLLDIYVYTITAFFPNFDPKNCSVLDDHHLTSGADCMYNILSQSHTAKQTKQEQEDEWIDGRADITYTPW